MESVIIRKAFHEGKNFMAVNQFSFTVHCKCSTNKLRFALLSYFTENVLTGIAVGIRHN